VLFSTVFACTEPRSVHTKFQSACTVCAPFVAPARSSRKSLPLNLFADPHSLTLSLSIFYKNVGGEGASLVFRSPFPQSSPCPPKSNRVTSFTDPRLLTTIESYRYKTMAGRGHLHPSGAHPQFPIPLHPNYLLMSSFASKRFNNGWRKGFVASGAPLMAWVISLAAVGKSPVFDESRASAK
jgi:hypothetical protein